MMAKDVEMRIAKEFYEAGFKKKQIMQKYSLRLKTLNDILARRKNDFVKGGETS